MDPVTPEAINAMLSQMWPGVQVRCVEVGRDTALAAIEPRPEDIRPGGFISGPTQFSAADSALWFLVSGAIGRVEPMALTAELSIRFLRPATGARLLARATLERRGRTQVVATVRVWTEDEKRPCSVAQGTYTLPR